MSQVVKPNEEIRIQTGSRVELHFSVSLEDGKEIDNTRHREAPVSLVIGDGNLLEGFENALMGLRAGDRRTIFLTPDKAFGEWNPDNVHRMSTVQFSPRPEIGQIMEFEDKAKSNLFGVVKAVDDDHVDIDFNHPLASKNITFEVEIFKVTPEGQQAVKLM